MKGVERETKRETDSQHLIIADIPDNSLRRYEVYRNDPKFLRRTMKVCEGCADVYSSTNRFVDIQRDLERTSDAPSSHAQGPKADAEVDMIRSHGRPGSERRQRPQTASTSVGIRRAAGQYAKVRIVCVETKGIAYLMKLMAILKSRPRSAHPVMNKSRNGERTERTGKRVVFVPSVERETEDGARGMREDGLKTRRQVKAYKADSVWFPPETNTY